MLELLTTSVCMMAYTNKPDVSSIFLVTEDWNSILQRFFTMTAWRIRGDECFKWTLISKMYMKYFMFRTNGNITAPPQRVPSYIEIDTRLPKWINRCLVLTHFVARYLDSRVCLGVRKCTWCYRSLKDSMTTWGPSIPGETSKRQYKYIKGNKRQE